MTVPIQFLWLSLGVLVILLPFTVYLATSGLRDRQVHLWCAGSFAMGIGFILIALREQLPQLVSFNLSQLLVICGYVVRTYSLRLDLDPSTEQARKIIKTYSIILAVYYLIYCWIVYIDGDERSRLIFVYGFQVYLALDLFRVSQRTYDNIPFNGTTLITYMAALLLIAALAKVILLSTAVGSVNPFQVHVDQYISFASYFLSYVLGNFGFVQLKMYKAHSAKEKALQKNLELEKLLDEKNRLLKNLALSSKSHVLGNMMASVAHELNQPLAAVRLNVDIIKRYVPGSAEPAFQEATRGLSESIARCAGVMKSLKSFFTRESVQLARIDLSTLLRDISALVSVEAKSQHITLITDIEDAVVVDGEKHQLQTVFLNLIHNAFEAMPRSQALREVTLRLFHQSEQAVFEITDTGVGIPADQVGTIFELYASSKASGMGVGLWLTKTILESHDATIMVDPDNATGTKFIVTFPRTLMRTANHTIVPVAR